MADQFYKILDYVPPTWASHLANVPRHKVKLSNLNTPIHPWNLPDVPEGFSVSIKRDDLTGCELSGNKVRNLELLFADAMTQGCRHVVTGGGTQSGHCRAVSLTARALGLVPHIVVEGADKEEDLGTCGNALLSRLSGARMYLTPYKGFAHFQQRVRTMADYVRAETRESCYCIAVGGASPVGVFGFISAFEELIRQEVLENFDDLVVTVATGGTVTGLSLGNYLTGSKLRVHAISIALRHESLYSDSNKLLKELGVSDVRAEDLFDVIEDYIGEGYGITTDQVLEFITAVSSSSGILLDPVYTGKAVWGLHQELTKNPNRFQGKRILFVHTGGLFGLFTGTMDRVLNTATATGNKVVRWPEMEVSPLL